MRLRGIAISFVAVAALIGCSTFFLRSTNVNFDSTKKHHTPEGFRNNYPHATDQNFFKWQWERLTQNTVAKAPEGGWASVLPSVKPDVEYLKKNRSERTITWLGHATVLLQTNGVNIITDPVFSERTSPVQFAGPKREVPFMMTPAELPEIDAVFVSHNHYDHLDEGTILDFRTRFPKATYIVPLGLKAWFTSNGITNVRELDWWDSFELANIKYTFVPAQHWSKRSLTDTNRSLWGGIVIEAPDSVHGSTSSPRTEVRGERAFTPVLDTGSPRTEVGVILRQAQDVRTAFTPVLETGAPRTSMNQRVPSAPAHDAGSPQPEETTPRMVSSSNHRAAADTWRFIYTGDTGYSRDFEDNGARFPGGFDWAAIPIGAYEPRWFMRAQHVNPNESVQILQDLNVRNALAVHWGTWMLTDEALDLPPKDLQIALKKYAVDPARFHVFKNGELRKI